MDHRGPERRGTQLAAAIGAAALRGDASRAGRRRGLTPTAAAPARRSSNWSPRGSPATRKARELAEARNTGENAAYQAERQLKDLAEQIDIDSMDFLNFVIAEVIHHHEAIAQS